MVQWMCEVGAFFFPRNNILVIQPDWVATRCKMPPSNVDAQLTPFVAFPLNLFSHSDAAFGESEADGALQPVHPLHHILWSNLQEGKRNVLIGCCAEWMRWLPRSCCCCRRPVCSGRTALIGLFDVWQRCCQMQLRSSCQRIRLKGRQQSFLGLVFRQT